MVYVVITRSNNYMPISRFGFPKIDSIYYTKRDAEERCADLRRKVYTDAYIEEYEVLSQTAGGEDSYDDRYYNEN